METYNVTKILENLNNIRQELIADQNRVSRITNLIYKQKNLVIRSSTYIADLDIMSAMQGVRDIHMLSVYFLGISPFLYNKKPLSIEEAIQFLMDNIGDGNVTFDVQMLNSIILAMYKNILPVVPSMMHEFDAITAMSINASYIVQVSRTFFGGLLFGKAIQMAQEDLSNTNTTLSPFVEYCTTVYNETMGGMSQNLT